MNTKSSSLWQTELPENIDLQLGHLFDTGSGSAGLVRIFFRADDIGLIDDNFIRMMQLFTAYDIPLCPALVPEWLTEANWQQILPLALKEELFCWHQHGFKHLNHESIAKKNEFGESRSDKAIQGDIQSGKVKLEEILGESFLPVFTPPWNRCSHATILALFELEFLGMSRSPGAQPEAPCAMPDLEINIDLHTRRETDPVEGMDNLFRECEAALASGCMGFMLHHQRMNENSFIFLEHLFKAINSRLWIEPCTFRELLLEQLSIGNLE